MIEEVGIFAGVGMAMLGCFGLFGIMAGEFNWVIYGLLMMAGGLSLAEKCSWRVRVKNYPEHAITSIWDDYIGDYRYTYEFYGHEVSEGDKQWANRLAKHYNIVIKEG